MRRQLEARFALGDLGFLAENEKQIPTFGAYSDDWLKNYARVECKTSTANGYEGRDSIKTMISDLVAKDLSRNTVRNALCVIRGIFNHAIEKGLVESNPAARLGRFTRTAKTADTAGMALTPAEAKSFLDAAKEVCPDYYLVFLVALRAGLRRGELVALRWGDIQFGKDENDSNRFMIVQHNYVRREHRTTKEEPACGPLPRTETGID